MQEAKVHERIRMVRTAEVYIVNASDRTKAVRRIFRECISSRFQGATVALKANYNSADPFPASTHIDTLRALTAIILKEKPKHLTLAERSGMGSTKNVLRDCGVTALGEKLGFDVVNLDTILAGEWTAINEPGLHWRQGFAIANIFAQADMVIQTCCLKTHRFGGVFTGALKNSVGLIARRVPGDPYDYMSELHQSPRQRSMIAEINKYYRTDLIVMDAAQVFLSGGPDKGETGVPNVILAGRDRIAIDAAGVALLRSYGSTPEVMHGSIFAQEQIARAAELGVGVESVAGIRLVPLDEHSVDVAAWIQKRFALEG
jgi:uncharacterized protein (DUF362 family)